MIDFGIIRESIISSIRKNGKRLITGDLLQGKLLEMLNCTEAAYKEDRDTSLVNKESIQSLEESVGNINVKDGEQDRRLSTLESTHTDDMAQIRLDMAGQSERIEGNTNDISFIEKELPKIKDAQDDITRIDSAVQNQQESIDRIDGEKQRKHLWVEIRNVGGGQYFASETANEIKREVDSGRDVRISFEEDIYQYDRYESGTSYFRFIKIANGVITNNRISVQYNKEAIIERISMKIPESIAEGLDVTDLYKAMRNGSQVSSEFVQKVKTGVEENKFMFVSDKEEAGVIVFLVVVCIKSLGDEMTFSAFDGRTSYILLLNTSNRRVSLDTERVGAEFSIFNNTDGKNIGLLDTDSSNADIQQCFRDARGEERIPDTGDVFNIHENSDLRDSGLVLSRTDDLGGIYMQVMMNDLVKQHIVFYSFHFRYNPSLGIESLMVESKTSTIIDPEEVSASNIALLKGRISLLESERNDFNISALKGSTYTLQTAISALNDYLGGSKAKTAGMRVTFVTAGGEVECYYYKKGSFVSTTSWVKIY